MSRASSPGVSRKRAAEGAMRQNLKHIRTDSSNSIGTADVAARLAAQLRDATAGGDAPSPRAGRSSRAKSTAGESRAEDAATTTRGDDDDNDDNAEDDSDIDEGDFGQQAEERAQESAADKARLRILLESFDGDQMARYEAFRRAGLNKTNLKKLANAITGQTVSQNVAVVIAGASKVFVGEVVEEALDVQKRRGGTGSLTPDDLREAYRSYKARKTVGAPQSRRIARRALFR